MKKFVIGFIFGAAILLSGCEDWLNVQPHDKIAEKELYSTPQGIRNALNGIYIDLNKSTLYGGVMMAQHLDVMAQNYNVGKDHTFEHYATYNYTDKGVKSTFQSVWAGMYKQIGNINLFLLNITGEYKNVLPVDEQNWLEGEALALRAFLHFDLLRLFGPVYLVDSTSLALPYYEKFDGNSQSVLTSVEFKDRILRDLDAAERLLKDDPIVKHGAMMEPDVNGDVINRYRGLRFNYYAVLALQARVALYVQMPGRALAYAQRVIAETATCFPFAKPNEWVYNAENPDRVLSMECLFSLQNIKRSDLYKNNFEGTLAASKFLGPNEKYLETLYESLDWRLRSWWEGSEKNVESGGTGTSMVTYNLMKYQKIQITSLLCNAVLAMIRKSEIYYIAAEVLVETDVNAARRMLDEVRKARGFMAHPETLDKTKILKEIDLEYQREFYGEGQLFFYYKRTNKTKIPNGTIGGKTITMDAKNYVVPVPDNEFENAN